MQTFKKGQIIPRRLGIVLASKRKAQHHFTFGQDCTWDGRVLKTVDKCHCCIRVPRSSAAGWATSKRGNGTRQYAHVEMPFYIVPLPDGRVCAALNPADLEREL